MAKIKPTDEWKANAKAILLEADGGGGRGEQ
jgi:hypothetical protein